ncbi:MAG: hypothetical protein ABFD97_20265, partial [Syntrophobacter sp.]
AMRIGGEVADMLKHYRLFCLSNGREQDPDYLWGMFEKRRNMKSLTDAEKIQQCLKNFLASEFSIVPLKSRENWCLIEEKLTFDSNLARIPGDQAWFSKQAAFRMIGDFVYRNGNTITIVDEKTGWASPDPKQLEIAMGLIPKAIPPLEMGGVWHVEAVFNVLSGYKPETIRLPVKSINEVSEFLEPIRFAMHDVNTWPEKYKDGYPAVACSLCERCSVPTCPIRKDVTTSIAAIPKAPVFEIPAALESREQAEKAVVFCTFISQLEKQLKDLLKTYVDANGRIVAGGMAADYSEAESFEISDMSQFVNLVTAYGATPQQVLDALSMNKTAFERLIKKAGLTPRLPMIKQLITTKISKRFGISKDKDKAA